MNKYKNFIINNYIYIVAIYLTLFFLLRILTSGSFERDESAQYILEGVYKWGYNTQPPLYTWVQNLFFKIFNNPFVALSLFKNMLIFFIYYLTYKITYILSNNKILSAIATSSLIFIPPFSWEFERDLTHSVIVTFSTMLLLYFIITLTNKKKIKTFDYILLGSIVSIGILSKYNFILFIIVLLIMSFVNQQIKHIVFNKKILISITVSIILLSPHIYWVLNHFNVATSGSIKKMDISNSYNIFVSLKVLFMALAELIAPYIILFILFFKKFNFKKQKFFKDYFLILIFILIAIVVIFKIQYFKSRWVVPLFLPIVIYMTLSIKNLQIIIAKWWLNLSILIMIGFLISFTARYKFPDLVSKEPSRFNYPAKKIYNYLKTNHIQYNKVLIADSLMGANIKYYNQKANYYFINDKIFNKFKGQKDTLIIFDNDSLWLLNWLNKKGIKVKYVKLKYKNSKRFYIFYFTVI